MAEKITLREKSKTKIKLNTIKAVLDLIQDNSFEDISIDDICKIAEISKMTFFKYFKNKDTVLLFYTEIWNLEFSLENIKHPKRGINAIYWFFEKMADEPEFHHIMISMISYIARIRSPPKKIQLSNADKLILHPQEPNILKIKMENLNDLLINWIKQGIDDGEIQENIDLRKTLEFIGLIFYGTVFITHKSNKLTTFQEYKQYLDFFFNIIRKTKN